MTFSTKAQLLRSKKNFQPCLATAKLYTKGLHVNFTSDNFLHGNYADYGTVDGDTFIFDSNGPRLFMSFASPTQASIADVESNEIELGLFEHGPIVFFLFRFGNGNWSDAPFNIHRNAKAHQQLPSEHLPLKIRYYDSAEKRLCAERIVSLPEDFSSRLHAAVKTQELEYLSNEDFIKVMQDAYLEYKEPWQMMAYTSVHCKVK